MLGHLGEDQRGDEHARRDGESVRGGEIARGAESEHEKHARHHEGPVDLGDVDLTLLGLRRVADLDAWAVAEVDGLLGEGERAGDQGLGGDDGGHRRQEHEGEERPGWCHPEERLVEVLAAVLEDLGALSEVVEQQGRQDDAEPTEHDRPSAEVAHVGVERLAAGDHEEERAHGQKALPRVGLKVPNTPDRIQRLQYLRGLHDVVGAEDGKCHEPDDHDRSEHLADPTGAPALHGEDADDDGHGNRDDVGGERVAVDLQALDGREHRDRRGDHAVAVQQGGTEEAEEQQEARPDRGLCGDAASRFVVVRLVGQERSEGEDSAFAVVVGAHHEEQVLDADDDDERPEHDGERAVDHGRVERDDGGVFVAVRPGDEHVGSVSERLADGVDRAGADVAVDHAERTDRECNHPAARDGSVGSAHGEESPRRSCGYGASGEVRMDLSSNGNGVEINGLPLHHYVFRGVGRNDSRLPCSSSTRRVR